MKRKVDVILLGHRFTVKTDKDDAYVRSLAAHVTHQVEEMRRVMRNATREEQVLLASLHLADELFEAHERHAAVRADIRQKTEAMVDKLSRALANVETAPATESNEPIDTRDDEDRVLAFAKG